MNIEAFFKISYGLYIISSSDGDRNNGYIANTVFQVTAEPALLAISCNKNNNTTPMIQTSKKFSISVLKQDMKPETMSLFGYKSGKDVNKFESINHITGTTGVPIVIDDSVAWFECVVKQEFDVGTHILFIAEIVNNDLLNNDLALTYAYYRDNKKGVAPKNAPTYIDKSKFETKKEEIPVSEKYKCLVCGYVYDSADGDEESHIPKGTKFEDLPDDWVCPICKAGKDDFEKQD